MSLNSASLSGVYGGAKLVKKGDWPKFSAKVDIYEQGSMDVLKSEAVLGKTKKAKEDGQKKEEKGAELLLTGNGKVKRENIQKEFLKLKVQQQRLELTKRLMGALGDTMMGQVLAKNKDLGKKGKDPLTHHPAELYKYLGEKCTLNTAAHRMYAKRNLEQLVFGIKDRVEAWCEQARKLRANLEQAGEAIKEEDFIFQVLTKLNARAAFALMVETWQQKIINEIEVDWEDMVAAFVLREDQTSPEGNEEREKESEQEETNDSVLRTEVKDLRKEIEARFGLMDSAHITGRGECFDFRKGSCLRGSSCRFQHTRGEGRDGGRGRGRGGGRGAGRSGRGSNTHTRTAAPAIKCFTCGGHGHYARDCPTPKEDQTNYTDEYTMCTSTYGGQVAERAESLAEMPANGSVIGKIDASKERMAMMEQVCVTEEDKGFVFDPASTTHLTGSSAIAALLTNKTYPENKWILMNNHPERVKIMGTLLVQCPKDKNKLEGGDTMIKLHDVCYAPNSRVNLMSWTKVADQAFRETGKDVNLVMNRTRLSFETGKKGEIVRGERRGNGLFYIRAEPKKGEVRDKALCAQEQE
jgi:hypothetical protein